MEKMNDFNNNQDLAVASTSTGASPASDNAGNSNGRPVDRQDNDSNNISDDGRNVSSHRNRGIGRETDNRSNAGEPVGFAAGSSNETVAGIGTMSSREDAEVAVGFPSHDLAQYSPDEGSSPGDFCTSTQKRRKLNNTVVENGEKVSSNKSATNSVSFARSASSRETVANPRKLQPPGDRGATINANAEDNELDDRKPAAKVNPNQSRTDDASIGFDSRDSIASSPRQRLSSTSPHHHKHKQRHTPSPSSAPGSKRKRGKEKEKEKEKELAPSLAEYLKSPKKYAPWPEWSSGGVGGVVGTGGGGLEDGVGVSTTTAHHYMNATDTKPARLLVSATAANGGGTVVGSIEAGGRVAVRGENNNDVDNVMNLARELNANIDMFLAREHEARRNRGLQHENDENGVNNIDNGANNVNVHNNVLMAPAAMFPAAGAGFNALIPNIQQLPPHQQQHQVAGNVNNNDIVQQMGVALMAGLETAAAAPARRAEALAHALTAAGVPAADSEAISAEAIAAAEAEIRAQRQEHNEAMGRDGVRDGDTDAGRAVARNPDNNPFEVEQLPHRHHHHSHRRDGANFLQETGALQPNRAIYGVNQQNQQPHLQQQPPPQPQHNIGPQMPLFPHVVDGGQAMAQGVVADNPFRNNNEAGAAAIAADPQVAQVLERAVSWWMWRRQQQQLHHPEDAAAAAVADGGGLDNLVRDLREREDVGGQGVENLNNDLPRIQQAPNNPTFLPGSANLGASGSIGFEGPPSAAALPQIPTNVAVYGSEYDTALHLAIRDGATDAALDLIKAGACVYYPNAKGNTPLILASYKGYLDVVQELLRRGAMPNAATKNGTTALIHACHHGYLGIVKELIKYGALVEQANNKSTTGLMRASQEGHEEVVGLLLKNNANVNRRNAEKMSALMLSSQRGHAGVVKMLLKAGAEIDAKTAQDSTALMLACKRGHFAVAKVLVGAGTDLMLKDCKGRTVLDSAIRRNKLDFASIFTTNAQLRLMKEEIRRERNFCLVRVWNLLQWERASIRVCAMNLTIHKVAENLDNPVLNQLPPSKRALLRAMTLPAPCIELITSFIPLPRIWDKRLMLLTKRCGVHPDSAVYNSLDLIDEVLEESGFLDACDESKITPPPSFISWCSFQTWIRCCDLYLSRCEGDNSVDRNALYSKDETNTTRKVEPAQVQRRRVNYLQVLAHSPPQLSSTLMADPYNMTDDLLERLKSEHDLQSLIRRLKAEEIHFEEHIATNLVDVARTAVEWCCSLRTY